MNESYMLIGSIFYLIGAIYNVNNKMTGATAHIVVGVLFFVMAAFTS